MFASSLLLALSPLAAPVSALPAGASEDSGWPHIRGPRCDGRTDAAGLFDGEVALELAWKTALGPSYSGIAVSSGAVVTCFSDGESDFVVALDEEGGAERWRYRLGDTYRGHDGSEDGPISSPIIHDGMVFALGPFGKLVALSLEDGTASWSKELGTEFGSTQPDYGYTTSPLVADDVLVVQTGGAEGRSVTGLDPATGEVRWSVGDGGADYQSPAAMELAGQLQVVVLDGKRILGLAPADGAVLWEHGFESERDSAATGFATPIDGARFAAGVSGTLAVFEVARDDDGLEVSEVFRSRELGRSYAAPVAHDGYIYGFKSDFLTCIDGSTGKRVWKSRPPGGRGLILVGDRLLVFGAEGVVAVVKATPEDYVEEARAQVLDHTGYTWPSFSGGRVLVRNSNEIASIAIVSSESPEELAAADGIADAEQSLSSFDRFVYKAETAEDPQAVVDAYMASQASFPIVEGNRMHVVFRGDVEDVAVAGNMSEGRALPMQRISSSDFHYRTYEVEPGTRWEYRFQVDFEDMQADPLNPRTVPGRRGAVLSEVVLPGYESATHYAAPEGERAERRGRMDSFEFESEMLGTTRAVKVYLPPGYDDSEESYPLMIVHQGSDWIESGQLPNTLDNLVGESVAPLVVVFIDPIRQWWFEGGGSGTEEYLDMLAEEFVPDLASRYRLSDAAADRVLMGNHSFAMTAVLGVLLHPETFGHAAVQSVFLGDVARHALLDRLENGPEVEATFYVDWNRYGARDLDAGHDYAADSRRLAEALKARGYSVAGGEANDSHGWGSWRSRSDRILTTFFPAGE